MDRSRTSDRGQTIADHPVFESGAGALVAELVRETKPGVGPLDVTTNLEMDLGFDSLTRVELLGLAEARLGTHVDEKESSRIFTLGELVEALTAAQNVESVRGRNWKEILNAAPDEELKNHSVFNQYKITRFAAYLMIKAVKLASVLFLRLRAEGLENLPRDYPFLICPNHESFLDGPLLISILPRRVIDRIFILGYTDYWQGWFMSRLGTFCNIVPIDPNVNLVRAMQIGAFGMKEGRVLLIFPEGTRTIDGHLGEFKKGSAILAYELGVPIVPVGMLGGYEMWPRGGSFRLHPVKFVFGEPVYPQAFAGASDPYTALTAALKERVKLLANDV
jgi:long-chain acyl-CoA synthetase